MKRLFFLLFCVVLLVSLFTVPAFAYYENPFLNVLDYDTGDGDNYFNVNGSSTVTYTLPSTEILTYVDLVVSYTGKAISSVEVGNGSNFTALTAEQIRTNEYRYYGNISSLAYSQLQIRITNDGTGTTYTSLLSFRAYRRGYASFYDRAGLWASPSDQSDIIYKESDGDPVKYPLSLGSETDFDYWTFSSYIYLTNWRKYDSIDALVFANTTTIDSITAYFDDVNLPVTISYINGTSPGFNSGLGGEYIDIDASGYESVYVPKATGVHTGRLINISIDLSSLSRNNTGSVMIRINGLFAINYANYIQLRQCTGFVNTRSVDADIYWYQKIWTKLSDGFTSVIGSVGDYFTELFSSMDLKHQQIINYFQELTEGNIADQIESDNFNTSVDDQSSQFEEMTDVMTSVEQPDISEVDMSAAGMVDPSSITLATKGISAALGNEIIVRLLLMAMTFALIGFILYGKK